MRADEKRSLGRFLYDLITSEADQHAATNLCLKWVSKVCGYVGKNATNSEVPISDEQLRLLALVSEGCGSVQLPNGDNLNATARGNRFKSGSVQLPNGDNLDYGSVLVDPETTFGLLQPRGSIFGEWVSTTCVGASVLAYDNDNRRRDIVVIEARWSPAVGKGYVILDESIYGTSPDYDCHIVDRVQIFQFPKDLKSERDVIDAFRLPQDAVVTVNSRIGKIILPWKVLPGGGRMLCRVGEMTNYDNGEEDENKVGVAGVVYVCNPAHDIAMRGVGGRRNLR